MKIIFYIFPFLFFLIKLDLCKRLQMVTSLNSNPTQKLTDDILASSINTQPVIDNLKEHYDYTGIGTVYDEISFPNPFEQSEECVLAPGVSHSWLCDPSHLLNANEQLTVEAALLKIRDMNFHKCSNGGVYYYQVAVAIVSQIYIKQNNSYEKSARQFAENILRTWGIGNKECHDGILLMYIKQIGSFVIAIREGVEKIYIDENAIKNNFINTYFATGSLSKALVESLNVINKNLPSNSREMTNTAKVFLVLIFFYLISIIILYILTANYSESL